MRMGPGESVEEETRLAGRTQGRPRDLLRQFSGGVVLREGKPPPAPSGGTEEDSGEIELSLGLSLGGCFGVDTARKKGLQRSSSIAAIPFSEHGEEVEGHAISPLLLKRTASLPTEAKEEQRKRRELQCLEPMEAKRKRSERDNGSGTWATDPASPPVPEGDACRAWWARPAPEHLGPWWTPNRIAADGICGGSSAATQWVKPFAASSQGSVGSQGSSSSGVSDFGSRPPKQEELPGNGTTHRRCLSGTQLPPGITERNGPAAVKTPKSNAAAGWEEEVEAPRKDEQQSLAAGGTVGRPNGSKAGMQDMPSVSTRGGGGPNGKLVEGFLYKYGAGEEVRIMCVCHGRFLSPAEFVRHAGGGDVTHPLRHIIVNTTPSCYP